MIALRFWRQKLQCWTGSHEWTCAAGEGIPPTPKQIEKGAKGFWEYATMYCKACGKTYRPKRGGKPNDR